MTLYYIDTCIWRDYFENRSDNFRPLGDWALKFFQKIVDEKSSVIYSDIIEEELLEEFIPIQIENILDVIPSELIIKIKTSQQDIRDARIIAKQYIIPATDSTHVVLAKKYHAILITRDKHMVEAQNIVSVKKPEDLL